MSRERLHDADTIRSEVKGLIFRLFHEKMSHNDYLHACGQLFDRPEWRRLTQYHTAEFLGMLRGAVEAAYATSLIWAHKVDGVFVDSRDPYFRAPGRISTIDPEQSRHIWAGTQKEF